MLDATFAKTQVIIFELKVADVMCKDVITVTPDIKMSDLRETLRKYRISGTPVVNGDKLVGIISIEDLIRWLSDGGNDCTVGQKMTKETEFMYSDLPVVHVIRRFEESGFGRFPIIDRKNNNLVGIITKWDIINGVLRKLEHEFQEEEIRHYRASHIFEDIIAEEREIYLSYKIKGKDLDKAGTASTQMKRNLKRLGIRPDIVNRLAIASYEAEMNLVLYADEGVMEYRVAPDEIYLKVEDNGPGIEDVEKAVQPGYSTAPDWVRELGFGAGMGLCNIKRCSDKMEIESNPGVGTTLNIHFYRFNEQV